MLASRLLLFAGWQGVIAFVYSLLGVQNSWDASAAWWTVTATLTNIVCIILLVRLYRREDLRYWDIFRFQRETVKSDLPVVAGLAVLSSVAATVPNILLAGWLFGNSQAVVPLYFRALPLWAILPTLVLFPVTIAFAELPTYFAYAMPRLEQQIGGWAAVLISALMLAFQHVTLPLIFDTRFIVWRLFMFVPFALMVALIMKWRPRLLPYLVIIHGLLDLSAAWMVLSASL